MDCEKRLLDAGVFFISQEMIEYQASLQRPDHGYMHRPDQDYDA